MRCSLVLTLLIICLPLHAAAEPPIPDLSPSHVEVDPGSFVVVPGGTGPSLAEQGVVVHLWLIDGFGGPVPLYPAEDIWLDDSGTGDIALCPNGAHADANTDEEGHTTISNPLAAGGWTQNGMSCYVAGMPIAMTPYGDDYVLPLDVNSPDINGDLVINISDVATFAEDVAGYHFRSDFNHDGATDLSDIALFGTWLVEATYCP